MKIVIGTRSSQLSLKQTNSVQEKLLILNSDLQIAIKIITTKGDQNMSPISLDTIGKDWFTKELDNALLRGEIDCAVHSLKDIPESLPEGLVIAGIPEREDPRDVLVAKKNILLKDLKKGAIIGTDSTRRRIQILHKRPDLIVKSIRGNINRRLSRLESDDYDALILAAAGLKRLGLASQVTEYFATDDIIPSPGQGALAVVVRKDNNGLLKLIEQLNYPPVVCAVRAERAFSAALGGGCQTPAGAYAQFIENKLTLYGMIGSMDGSKIFKKSVSGRSSQYEELGYKLAEQLLKKNNYNKLLQSKFVVVTRSEQDSLHFKKALESYGATVYHFLTIATKKNTITKETRSAFDDIKNYDWIIFTSTKGVDFFIRAYRKLKKDFDFLTYIKIAVVGPKTAMRVKNYNLQVSFMPTITTSDELAKQIENIKGKKLLLFRSPIASKVFVKDLREKGAIVTDIPIYKTVFVKTPDEEFEELLKTKKIDYLTFTSPSTVKGFLERTKSFVSFKKNLSIPVLCIGPVTAKEAKMSGFLHIFTAKDFTTNGMIKKLLEIV